ncbi:uncharacterized protein C1orf112 homolog [Macrosteles quadrilineatus]|uniref:uncharacterized protein C1orf112 homolog n=1 Tax=Macrosteles quadrilineatus TaxID=74068 RepID=UPI0023E1E236|nr:uncharacterized protein C1orf112 homolog [Macrosteles quadrilineatus]
MNHRMIDEADIFEDDSLIPNVLKNIEICIQVLSDMDNMLAYLISFDQLSGSDFPSAPKNVAEVVYLVFSHCQKSKTEYKDVFSTVRSELMSLFQHCYQVQVKLFTLLNEKLVFNCAFEEEIQSLVEIIDTLNLMSEVVAELDTMSLVAHWKGFAQLTQTYSAHLCSRLDVSRPIIYLSANIAHQLDNLKVYVNADKKVVLRALKISSLQLKVLIKLCEQYKHHLGDCHSQLLSCLISLTSRTQQSLSVEGLTEDIAAQVTTHLSAGAAPLLSHLLADPVFVKNYLQHADELQSGTVATKFGFCNLTSMILKKFTNPASADDEAKVLWIKSTMPLVETTFKILNTCEDVFFSYEEDVYQTLLTHTAAFIIATTSVEMFSDLESMLVKHLLQPSLWPAFFTSDLLCLIARVGSDKLCLQLVSLLRDLCSCWPTWDRCRPEWCYVTWTTSRLTQFLAEDDRKSFSSQLPHVTGIATDLNNLLNKPFSNESIQLYNALTNNLTTLRDHIDLYPDVGATLAQPICQMWSHMMFPEDLESSETCDWFSSLFSLLVSVSSHVVVSLDTSQIVNILNVLDDLCSSSTIFKCGSCTFLRSLASKLLPSDSNQNLVYNEISSLFVKLLLDSNPLVKQFALETFSYFAYVTKHEEIVALTVAKDVKLQNIIAQYLEGIPIVKSDTELLKYLSSIKVPFVHKCRINNSNIEKDNVELNPSKKFKSSENVLVSVLEKIEKDLSAIEEFKKCSEETRRLVLGCIAKRLDEMV